MPNPFRNGNSFDVLTKSFCVCLFVCFLFFLHDARRGWVACPVARRENTASSIRPPPFWLMPNEARQRQFRSSTKGLSFIFLFSNSSCYSQFKWPCHLKSPFAQPKPHHPIFIFLYIFRFFTDIFDMASAEGKSHALLLLLFLLLPCSSGWRENANAAVSCNWASAWNSAGV